MKPHPGLSQVPDNLTLDELVKTANSLLPQYVAVSAEVQRDARFRAQVNARLVRHLTTIGVLDEPQRVGREARYYQRHVLQVLVARRLMSQGHSTHMVKKLLGGASSEQLEAFLHGKAQLAVAHAPPSANDNAALDFLKSIKRRKNGVETFREQTSSASLLPPSPAVAPSQEAWTRLSIQDGLELHLRDDFIAPRRKDEREALFEAIKQQLDKAGRKIDEK